MDTAVAFAAELEQRDAALAERLAFLVELGRRVDETKVRAEQTGGFLERLPRDRERLEATLAESERNLDAAQTELAEARRAVERARSDDAKANAGRRDANATTDVGAAEERRAQLAARREELEREEAAAVDEIRELDLQARVLAMELETAPRVAAPDRPAAGLDGLVDWASRAHAAVFVARSGLETERERVVREANELAASVLDEPLYATSVALVLERLEERFP
ncbi:MAG: hypothetical protein MSC30_12765 [Gaiellaceae bacterium MAG52_C11]|nr:hypothetical protein [Candidatus Gaiellasilicea maunaloa]